MDHTNPSKCDRNRTYLYFRSNWILNYNNRHRNKEKKLSVISGVFTYNFKTVLISVISEATSKCEWEWERSCVLNLFDMFVKCHKIRDKQRIIEWNCNCEEVPLPLLSSDKIK